MNGVKIEYAAPAVDEGEISFVHRFAIVAVLNAVGLVLAVALGVLLIVSMDKVEGKLEAFYLGFPILVYVSAVAVHTYLQITSNATHGHRSLKILLLVSSVVSIALCAFLVCKCILRQPIADVVERVLVNGMVRA